LALGVALFRLFSKTGREREFGHFFANEFFDALQAQEVGVIDECEGGAFAFGAGRATDAVHIIFGIAGGFKVYHEINPVNVNATAQHIGGNKDVNF